MGKKELITVLSLILILLVSGCGNRNESTSTGEVDYEKPLLETSEENSEEVSPENLVEEEVILTESEDDKTEPEEFQIAYNSGPYLGKMIKEFKLPRLVMVMIENAPAARPQSGLEEASIVYEYLVEGGITRFAALYYELFPERVGPVRSTRPYFIELALEYNALLLHVGASPEGFNLLATSGVEHIDELYNQEFFWRQPNRRPPHNLYTGLKPLMKIFDQKVFDESVTIDPRFSFQGVEFVNRTETPKAHEVKIHYWGGYTVSYKYDQSKGRYLRFIDGLPHLMEGGIKLFAYNILIQTVETKVKDDEGRLEMQLNSSNKAILIKDGFAYPGKWIKEEGLTRFLDQNGEEWSLNPGQTWIQVVPETIKIEYN